MLILTNFKAYPTGVFSPAHTLVKDHIYTQNQAIKNNISAQFAVAINSLDIQNICSNFANEIDIYAQHCDNATFGPSTGKILPEMLKKMGVKGVVLNHSENRFSTENNYKELIETINFAKKSGLSVVCCSENVEEGKFLSENSNADFIAVEPPELIGGDISVSSARPELISESVENIGENKVLIGAGIKTGSDVKIALEKGAVGVLLASGVTKSDNPKDVLLDLIS